MELERNHKKNTRMKRGVLLLGAGYLFFLTSRLWYPAQAEYIEPTPLFEIQTYDTYEISVESWDYSEDQEMMEVYLALENTGILDLELSYEAVERTGGDLPVVMRLREPELTVLQIKELPANWKEVSLRISGSEKADMLRLYTNVEEVHRVEEIVDTDRTGYEKEHDRLRVAHNKELIRDKQEEMADLVSENEKIEKRIRELENSLEEQTEEEQAESHGRIEQAQAGIATNKEKITALEEEIKSLEEKNKLLEGEQ